MKDRGIVLIFLALIGVVLGALSIILISAQPAYPWYLLTSAIGILVTNSYLLVYAIKSTIKQFQAEA